jgi:hypothetical protein
LNYSLDVMEIGYAPWFSVISTLCISQIELVWVGTRIMYPGGKMSVSVVLLLQYCWNMPVSVVLLLQYCWNMSVSVVLLLQYCWNMSVSVVLLLQYCWKVSVSVVLLAVTSVLLEHVGVSCTVGCYFSTVETCRCQLYCWLLLQ